jgi:hypothetical protein
MDFAILLVNNNKKKIKKIMFEKLFNEIFKDVDWEDIAKKMSELEENDEKNDSSYFHCITDEYNDGVHVSHKEKEIKDGKVVKDVDFCIEDKKEQAKERTKEEDEKNVSISYYEEKLKKSLDLLEQAQNTIINQQKEIENYDKRCNELEEKFEKVAKLLGK